MALNSQAGPPKASLSPPRRLTLGHSDTKTLDVVEANQHGAKQRISRSGGVLPDLREHWHLSGVRTGVNPTCVKSSAECPSVEHHGSEGVRTSRAGRFRTTVPVAIAFSLGNKNSQAGPPGACLSGHDARTVGQSDIRTFRHSVIDLSHLTLYNRCRIS